MQENLTEGVRSSRWAILTWRWTPPRGDPAAARLRSRSGGATTDRAKTDSESVQQWLPLQRCTAAPCAPLTFSSPAATLKASSMTEPTAMRTAADECISFHTVSLSTCRGQRRHSVPPQNTRRSDLTEFWWEGLHLPRFLHREARHTSSG